MTKDKQIEEMTCKNCIHYEVCMYVNAQAVAYVRAENCKLFKNNAGYRKASEVAREIFEEIEKIFAPTISALFMTSETLVDVSKSHISEEKAIKDIRNYLHNAICSKYQLEKALAELKKKWTEEVK